MTEARVTSRADAAPGDWVQIHMIGGGQPRRGEFLEVRGGPGHQRYRVRWDEEHESIHFPAEGTSIERGRRRAHARTRA